MRADIQQFLSFSLNNQTAFTPFSFQLDQQLQVNGPCPGVLEISPISKQKSNNRLRKSIVISAGVHGNESAPIELVDSIIFDVFEGTLDIVHPVLFIYGNLPSIEQQVRFVEENLNRLFHYADKSNSMESKRANILMQVVSAFFERKSTERLHYDLHTAIRPSKNEKFAVYPYLYDKSYDKSQLCFLSACDINTVLLSQAPTATFSDYSSSQHNAHAFTLELGKVRPFGQNDMSRFVDIDKQLRQLISSDEVALPKYSDCALEIFNVNQTIIKQQDDFKLHFEDDAPN
ncbi:MAG: succinylglutamate desuccinylase, partial [Pseudomonadota bacterium]